MQHFTNTTERGFQQYITQYLVVENGFIETKATDFDRAFCINPQQVLAFIKATQPDAAAMIEQKGERA
jgi:hypothetical protein